MSGDLAVIETVSTQVDPTGGRLVAWARAANAANSLAKALIKTTFVPKGMTEEGNATAAILMGDELGFTPLASLKSIYVVHGTPALYTRSMVALVLSRGHEIWTDKSSNLSVTVNGRRKGSEHIETATWTIERASLAGYTSNKKYQSNPQEMLYAKAAAEIARKIGADVLLGVPYSVEDLELEESTTTTLSRSGEGGEGTKVARRSRTTEKVTIPEPDIAEDKPTDTIESDSGETADETTDSSDTGADNSIAVIPVTKAQIGKIGALMSSLGLTKRDAAIAYVVDVIGRPITSRLELSVSEASLVIESLDADVRVQNAEKEVGE